MKTKFILLLLATITSTAFAGDNRDACRRAKEDAERAARQAATLRLFKASKSISSAIDNAGRCIRNEPSNRSGVAR